MINESNEHSTQSAAGTTPYKRPAGLLIRHKIRKIIKPLLAALILGGGVFLAIHYYFKTSTAYRIAEEYVRSDSAVATLVGTVQHVDLGWSAFRFNGNGSEGSASFTLRVAGSKQCKPIFISMQQQVGWKVLYASTSDDEGRLIVIKDTK